MYKKEFTTKKGSKITVSIEKTTLKEKLSFIFTVAIILGIIWWFSR